MANFWYIFLIYHCKYVSPFKFIFFKASPVKMVKWISFKLHLSIVILLVLLEHEEAPYQSNAGAAPLPEAGAGGQPTQHAV